VNHTIFGGELCSDAERREEVGAGESRLALTIGGPHDQSFENVPLRGPIHLCPLHGFKYNLA
jgi:hypothetical protein